MSTTPMKERKMKIEVCVENTDGLIVAQEAGADRIELCASLLEGGLTPSVGMIRKALEVATVPFFVIVRPRGGDFLYSEVEFEAMLEDVRLLRDMRVQGVVVGCLNADGTVDEGRTRLLVDEARPMAVTFHRAFDRARDPLEAVEALVRCGVDRVLTSGRHDTAIEGAGVLRASVEAAEGRLIVLACGALDETNVAEVVARTGVEEIHFAARRRGPSRMRYRNPSLGVGATDLERGFERMVTDAEAIRATIAAARAAGSEP